MLHNEILRKSPRLRSVKAPPPRKAQMPRPMTMPNSENRNSYDTKVNINIHKQRSFLSHPAFFTNLADNQERAENLRKSVHRWKQTTAKTDPSQVSDKSVSNGFLIYYTSK